MGQFMGSYNFCKHLLTGKENNFIEIVQQIADTVMAYKRHESYKRPKMASARKILRQQISKIGPKTG